MGGRPGHAPDLGDNRDMSNGNVSSNSSVFGQSVGSDMRFALRQMRKAPGFAVTVVLTLAIGIGVNLAVFQLLHAILFAKLPVPRPSELYALETVKSPFDEQWIYSYAAYQRMRQATGESASLIARSGIGYGVMQIGGTFSGQTSYEMVSDNFFTVLGISPVDGRIFELADDTPGQLQTPVVLSYGFAREKLGYDSAKHPVTGMHVTLNRVPVTVIGVAPPGFSGVVKGQSPDVWLPLSAQATGHFGSWFDSLGPGDNHDLSRPYYDQPGIFWLWTLARIPAGAQATERARWTQALQPDLAMIANAPVNATRQSQERERIRAAQTELVSAAGGEGSMSKTYLRPLTFLMAMAAVVFLAGCLNLANLQTARHLGRQREISLRIALGASRWRVLRQLLAEDGLLIAIGAALALATCSGVSALLLRWASGRGELIPVDLRFGPELFLAGFVLLVFTLMAFSLLPAWRITRSSLGAAMQSSMGNIAGQSGSRRRLSNVILAGQVSLSLLLVSMAILFAQTILNLSHMDAGLDREHVLSVRLDLLQGSSDTRDAANQNQRILEKLRSLPYVRDAGISMCRLPVCTWNTALHVAGHPELAESQLHGEENHVSTGYFRALGIPLLAGRDFGEQDRRDSQPVVVLNHAYAMRFFGPDDPVGHYIGYKAAPEDHEFLIVGVVGDAHVDGLKEAAPPVAYFSLEQGNALGGTIEIRAAGSPANVVADVRAELLSAIPNLPIDEIVTLDQAMNDGLSTQILLARLVGVFALLTVLLAAIGFYGLLSFQVQRRTSEIGIRMALGSTRGQVQGIFLRHTAKILLAGIVFGLVLTEVLGRTARALFFGVRESNPLVLLLSVSLLAICGLLATLIPARRAASVDPIQALRTE
jgi:predicted permease